MCSLPFLPGELPEPTPEQAGRGTPRLRVPQRDQVEYCWNSLDERLDPDSPARAVWALVCRLDLDAWRADIKAVEGHVGRDATDPRLLVALWVFATLKGIGSARELERLCENQLAYQWLRGGVSVNYHLLADFRAEGGAKWDALLTQIVATLRAEGLAAMDRVAQDGMRVRADAGQSSCRKAGRLAELLEEAQAQVETRRQLAETDPEELTHRQRGARERAARERQERIVNAAHQCDELRRKKEERDQGRKEKSSEARSSSTDPEARVIKFSGGGCRPAFNVQFATDTATGLVVGVDVTNAGTDSAEMPPMLDQLKMRYDTVPGAILVDGGFASLDAIDAAEARPCQVDAPVKDADKQKKAGKDPYARQPHDTDQTAAWRERRGEEASKMIDKLRAQTAEWVNALCRNRGFWRLPVRGRVKCRIVATLFAITHNVMHQENVRATVGEARG